MIFKEKKIEEIRTFMSNEICFGELKKNEGICETGAIARNAIDEYDITIGVTYEDSDGWNGGAIKIDNGQKFKECYHYNIFAGEEYVSLNGKYIASIEDKLPISILCSIRDTISELLGEEIQS